MFQRTAATLLIIVLLSCVPACMGRMAVTSGVRKFNVNVVENRWGREAIFVGFYIIPIYPFCAALDLFLINSLEFWQGKNPISGEDAVVDK